jgi:hypothetical protein
MVQALKPYTLSHWCQLIISMIRVNDKDLALAIGNYRLVEVKEKYGVQGIASPLYQP